MSQKHSIPAVQYILNIVGAGGCLVVWLSGCRSSVAEHRRLKPGVLGLISSECPPSSCSPHNVTQNQTCLHSLVSCLGACLKDVTNQHVVHSFKGCWLQMYLKPLSKFRSTFQICCVASPIVLLCLANGWDTAGSIEVYVLERLAEW